jgi:hypothetical protein
VGGLATWGLAAGAACQWRLNERDRGVGDIEADDEQDLFGEGER